MLDEQGQQRNCENMEIYASSPSYLITAGGKPARWVIFGEYGEGYKGNNLGVAVPTSFMPTGRSASNMVSLRQLTMGFRKAGVSLSSRDFARSLGFYSAFSLVALFAKKG